MNYVSCPQNFQALDESKETLNKQQVRYIVDKELLSRCGTIIVDFFKEAGWRGFALIA